MSKLRVAVVGIGYLGAFHAQKYRLLPECELVAIIDLDEKKGKALAQELNCKFYSHYEALYGQVDAVSIATPTHSHFTIGKALLEKGIHILMEKPMTTKLDEAEILIALAKKHELVLQIGYLERFNPVVQKALSYLNTPQFIESTRIMGFNPRNKDINVVLDLMIHDIDLIAHMVKDEIKHIDASGASVLTLDLDIANARIQFENGCTANVTASRISLKPERKLRIFANNAYLSLDLQQKLLSICTKGEGEMFPGIPAIAREEFRFEEQDALLLEIQSFIHAVITKTPPVVSGEEGLQSLKVALQITETIMAQPHG